MDFELPAGYRARQYRGPSDHAAMASILGRYRLFGGNEEIPTVEQMDVTYANLTNCDPATDIAVIEIDDGTAVAYARATWEDINDGIRDCIGFSPTLPEHLAEPLFRAMTLGQERHMRPWADGHPTARFRAHAPHPGPNEPATNESAWLESMGYEALRFSAGLVRPNLDDIPDRRLPDGVVVRPVTADMLRQIWETHDDAFRHDWGYHERTEADFQVFLDDPLRDESLWKIGWVGDTVVGQVKSFINTEENAEMGYLRGYTEYISTHEDWRNQGIAGALLAMSLHELRDRGMTEAALGADTDNPGGAFHLYTSLGFELRAYEAAYAKPIH